MSFRTDRHNNPAAFTTQIAAQAGLTLGVDYTTGDAFNSGGQIYYTAKLLGDPIELTKRVIDNIGYFTKTGSPRWTYIALPKFIWDQLTDDGKLQVIAYHYKHEGGTELNHLFVKDIQVSVGDKVEFGDKIG